MRALSINLSNFLDFSVCISKIKELKKKDIND